MFSSAALTVDREWRYFNLEDKEMVGYFINLSHHIILLSLPDFLEGEESLPKLLRFNGGTLTEDLAGLSGKTKLTI